MRKSVINAISIIASVVTLIQFYFSITNKIMYIEIMSRFFFLIPVLFWVYKWFCHSCIKAAAWVIALINTVDGKFVINKYVYAAAKVIFFMLWFSLWYLGYGILLRDVLTGFVGQRAYFIEICVWFACMLFLSCRQELLFIFRNKDLKQQLNEAVVLHTVVYVIYFMAVTLHLFIR